MCLLGSSLSVPYLTHFIVGVGLPVTLQVKVTDSPI